MLSQLALPLALVFIGWMLARDMAWRRLPSHASWIPGIWLALASSRPVSFWLAQVGVGQPQASRLDGSPVNVIFNGCLFLAALLVLHRRKFAWLQFFSSNKALSGLYLFFLASMLWSPYPVPTLKRVVQDFGCVLVGLVLLTEKDAASSTRMIFTRVSYILFPLSVVCIHYFPDIGRVYSSVSGAQMLSGVAGHKNMLGQMTMVLCLVLLWDLSETKNSKAAVDAKSEYLGRVMSLGIGLYLLVISRSATSWICFGLGLVLLLSGGRLARTKRPRRLFISGATAIVLVFTLNQSYGLTTWLSESLERGSGLSGRTEIWTAVLETHGRSFLGSGFRAFWETSAGEDVWRRLGANPLVQAHNGYLEMYLNGGFAGLGLLAAFLWASGRDATDKLVGGHPLGRLAVVFWPILLLANVTESQFFQIGTLWFITLIVVMDSPWTPRFAMRATAGAAPSSAVRAGETAPAGDLARVSPIWKTKRGPRTRNPVAGHSGGHS